MLDKDEHTKQWDPIQHLRKGGKVRQQAWRKECFLELRNGEIRQEDGSNAFHSHVGQLFTMPDKWQPVRETFGFAEAVKLVPGAHVRREGRPNLFLSERITMELGWFSFGENFSHGITKGDLDATDFYVVEGGK